MQYLKNNTARLIIIASLRLIPRLPVKVNDFEALRKMYPEIDSMIQSGQLVLESKDEAKAEIKKVEAELKEMAEEKDIKTNAKTKKTKKAIKESDEKDDEKKVTKKAKK